MRHKWTSSICLLILSILFFPANPLRAESGSAPWIWSKREVSKIEKIQKKLDKNKEGYWERGDNIYLVKSNISPRFTAELCLYMDVFLTVFPKVFTVPPAGKVMSKLCVIVHKSKAEYLAASGAPSWSGGVQITRHQGGWKYYEIHSFPWKYKPGEELDFSKHFNRGVVQHEGTHAMVARYSGTSVVPVFFNEGCATYFETWDLRVTKPGKEERQERLGRGFHLGALARKLKSSPDYKPRLSQCLGFTSQIWGSGTQTDISLRYALAESFVDMLLTSSSGRKTFKKMMKAAYKRWPASKGVKPLLPDKSIAKLEPEWHEHIQDIVDEWSKAGSNLSQSMSWEDRFKLPISLSGDDLSLDQAFADIGKQAHIKMVADDSITEKPEKLSFSGEKLTFKNVVEQIKIQLQSGWKVHEGQLIFTRNFGKK